MRMVTIDHAQGGFKGNNRQCEEFDQRRRQRCRLLAEVRAWNAMASKERPERERTRPPDLPFSSQLLNRLLQRHLLLELLHPALPGCNRVLPSPPLNFLLIVARDTRTFFIELVFFSLRWKRCASVLGEEGRNVPPGCGGGCDVSTGLSRGVQGKHVIGRATFGCSGWGRTSARAACHMRCSVHPTSCSDGRRDEARVEEGGRADGFKGIFVRKFVLHPFYTDRLLSRR